MIPVISATSYSTSFEDKQGKRTEPLIAYCVGGVAIGNSDVLYGTQWVATVEENEVRVRVEGSTDYTVALTGENIEFISLAFDQQMNPVLGYVQAGVSKMQYYNSLTAAYDVLTLPDGSLKPFVALDIREQVLLTDADLVLTYVRNNNLYARIQRESYGTERLLREAAGRDIVRFGRNAGNRLQWRLLPIIE